MTSKPPAKLVEVSLHGRTGAVHDGAVRVNTESPAEVGGLKAGDFVLAVDGVKVATLEEFYKVVTPGLTRHLCRTAVSG